MSPKKAVEVRIEDHNSQKWQVPLTEEAFEKFISQGGDNVKKVFGEGSLFSPLLFGKFFDPGDAFPLWEFESEALLSKLRSASKSSVDWMETDVEYILKAELPGGRKIDIEICVEKGKVVDISGQWKVPESDSKDWKTKCWWEHGFVRRLELPNDANWRKMEVYVENDTLLEIKIPKVNK